MRIDKYFRLWADKSTVYFDEVEPFESRPRGEWIRNFSGTEFYWYCSNCKTEYYEEDLYMGGNEFPNYCPNCGADMRGEE